MKLAFAALGAAAALAACAPYYPPPPPPMAGPLPPPPAEPYATGLSGADCFRSADIVNHTFGDDQTLYLNVRGRGVYRVEMTGACLAGTLQSDPILMRQPPGSSLVCRPLDLDISLSRAGGGFTTSCIVRSISRLTPEQVMALPERVRP